MSATSVVFPSLVVLAVHVGVNHQLTLTNVVSHIEGINIFHVNHHQQTVQRPLWRKFLVMWCILMSATSLVFSPLLSLTTTMPSTTNSFVVRHETCWKYKKRWCQPPSLQHITSYMLEEIPTKVIHPNVSDLLGLLVHVVLAVHNAVDHQPIWAKSGQVGYPIKRFSLSIKELQLSVG